MQKNSNLWGKIAEESCWPAIVMLKDADKRTLPSFPFSRGHIRNLLTGKDKNKEFASRIISIGGYKAMLREDLVDFLNKITTGPTANVAGA